ncbi:hypothetical protein AKJ58_00290 [candidate division MSBL1 archaeon SCGC-AAA385D11]|uniref:Helicase HerA central domain-containing protein n=1 Tax=candidate division MSBL1 archaeon SCGC-AAA385D11 TaxID=1698286 RepID=A0A133VPG5_9EURY|nr:hypothetical protein AKJ58_00290 [candidate division MSBL1 archaeon SCGC-AAA385D11]
MFSEIGTVICTLDGPSSTEFSFVVTNCAEDIPVKRGQFVELESEEGKMVAQVQDLIKTNRYFMRAESVREYERGNKSIASVFPADRWEYIVARAKASGIQTEDGIKQVSFPASPGQKVFTAGSDTLASFLGINAGDGVDLGKLRYHDLSTKLNLTKLLRKHVAILAMSGAGKSYSAMVLLEELMDRAENEGRIASIIADVHGEYTSLARPSEEVDYSDRAFVVEGKNIQIGAPDMSAYQFREFAPDMSGSQTRELNRIIRQLQSEMRSGKGRYDLDDIIREVEKDGETKKQIRKALADRLYDLKNLHIFGKNDYPNWRELAQPGKVAILNLSDILNLRKKRIILAYFARKLFNKRKSGQAPPFALFLEEAHQFAPSKRSVISKPVLRTLAREGRKFYASLILISQRPVKLSTTVLSQANTHIILRVTNPYDLDHIKKSSERITGDTIDIISSLPVGEALVVGEAVNHPVFVKIRKRRSQEAEHGTSLKEVARHFEEQRIQKREDAKAFM